jgi:hypothetical protein
VYVWHERHIAAGSPHLCMPVLRAVNLRADGGLADGMQRLFACLICLSGWLRGQPSDLAMLLSCVKRLSCCCSVHVPGACRHYAGSLLADRERQPRAGRARSAALLLGRLLVVLLLLWAGVQQIARIRCVGGTASEGQDMAHTHTHTCMGHVHVHMNAGLSTDHIRANVRVDSLCSFCSSTRCRWGEVCLLTGLDAMTAHTHPLYPPCPKPSSTRPPARWPASVCVHSGLQRRGRVGASWRRTWSPSLRHPGCTLQQLAPRTAGAGGAAGARHCHAACGAGAVVDTACRGVLVLVGWA